MNDAQWIERIRETAADLRNNSLALTKYPHMAQEARARELAALYIGEIADMYEVGMKAAAHGVATRHPRCGYPYCACVGECFAASQPGGAPGVATDGEGQS